MAKKQLTRKQKLKDFVVKYKKEIGIAVLFLFIGFSLGEEQVIEKEVIREVKVPVEIEVDTNGEKLALYKDLNDVNEDIILASSDYLQYCQDSMIAIGSNDQAMLDRATRSVENNTAKISKLNSKKLEIYEKIYSIN